MQIFTEYFEIQTLGYCKYIIVDWHEVKMKVYDELIIPGTLAPLRCSF